MKWEPEELAKLKWLVSKECYTDKYICINYFPERTPSSIQNKRKKLGYKGGRHGTAQPPTRDRTYNKKHWWIEDEDNIVLTRSLLAACALLPHRSRGAIRTRRYNLQRNLIDRATKA